jgi:hypothetical protein
MKKDCFIYSWLLSILLLAYGCKKLVTVAPPIDSISNEAAFADSNTAVATVNGLYAYMAANTNYFGSFGFTLYTGLSSDELYNTSSSTEFDPFTTNSLLSTTGDLDNIWSIGYKTLYQANNCIEGLTNTKSLSFSNKNQLLGEVKFIRAFCYFYLSNLFGDIPLPATTNYQANASLPRVSIDSVSRQIIADLQDAEKLLSDDYVTNGKSRANKYAADAFLAKVFLYLGDWADAENYADKVINSGTYSLETLENVFLSGSNETILQLDVSGVNIGYNTYEGFQFIPVSATRKPRYALTPSLLSAFEPGDHRMQSWISKSKVGGQDYFYPFKYKVRTASDFTEYPIYFRLAEQYLIRAEARAHQNKSQDAIDDLNTIRTRAGLAGATVNNEAALLLAIEHERQVELFAELGSRWFDLKRTKRANDVLKVEKPSWVTTDTLYPIPLTEIQLNPALTQNEGY